MIEHFKKILILAPHTDDGEFGCGGTISRLREAGCEVYYAAFSICEESVPEGLPKDILQTELYAATSVLEIPRSNVFCFRYPVRRFPAHRQEILEDIIKIRKEVSPDLVFIPSLNDVHQDHHVIAEEGLRAFKNSTLLSYELFWNIITFEHTCFVRLEERHVQQKIESVQAYKSQQFRKYSSPDLMRSQAVMRGVQAGMEYAEVFEVVRLNI